MEGDRYSRLKRYAGFAATLDRWQALTAAVVGLGGLGCGLVQYLARLGVGKLILIDRDIAAFENLGHQLLYTVSDAQQGLPKAVAAAAAVAKLNPGVEVQSVTAELTRKNISDRLADAQVIFDGLDSYYVRLVVNDYAIKSGKPFFYAGVVRGELSAKAIIPGRTACLHCLLPQLPGAGDVPTCATEGVFPPLLAVANAIQLDLANRWLAGEAVADELYSLRLPDWGIRTTDTAGLQGTCPACSRKEFAFLDGVHDHLSEATCHGERYSMQLPAEQADLERIAEALRRSGDFQVALNSYCLSAVNGAVRYTLFPDGRLLAEGIGAEQEMNSFAAEYLGI